VARRYATGVTVVGVSGDGGVHALTANSFVTLSLTPPLIGVAIGRQGRFRPLVEKAGWFGVSILAASQQRWATFYADRNRPLDAAEYSLTELTSPGLVPIVPGCLGYFMCAVDAIQPVGDHDLIIGEVWQCECSDPTQDPLVFLDGRFRS